ncbi:MAG: hypothetical protein HY763_10890 [Planctomycetes bacterium]|nr:hypothetical protein [Planctomycetota bacterium]
MIRRALSSAAGGRCHVVGGLAALFIHLGGSSAWAQRPAALPNEASALTPWLVAAGVAVVIGFSAFLNPKRSHLS